MTGYQSKKAAALDEDGMYLVHHTEPVQESTLQEKDRKRGSIALARSLCYKINGAADDSDDMDGGGYGSVDIAEILSAEVVRLQAALAQPAQRPWVDLTEHELFSIWMMVPETEDRFAFARAVLAKSKELNT